MKTKCKKVSKIVRIVSLKYHETGKSRVDIRWEEGVPARLILRRMATSRGWDEEIPFQMPDRVTGIGIDVGKGRTIKILETKVK